MPGFETLLLVALLVGAALGALGLAATLARSHTGATAAAALGRGDFATALATAETGPRALRDELYHAAVAARHLLELERAAELLDRLLAAEPDDGEAWLERGLVAAYAGDAAGAEAAWTRAEARRADLLESLTLHRAWLALRRGDEKRARRLFEEIEAPLVSKLDTDLGAGDPLFAEWFLHAAVLWRAAGEEDRGRRAFELGRAAAPASRLHERVGDPLSAPPDDSGHGNSAKIGYNIPLHDR